MANILRPRRFVLCGVPVTYELLLRLAILGLTITALVIASKPKVMSILRQANVVSVSMLDSTNIPVPGALICGGRIDSVDVQILTRGLVYPNGTVGQDDIRLVPAENVRFVNATDLNLRANGDWPNAGHCVILDPKELYFAKNTNGADRNALEQIIFVLQTTNDFVGQNDDGLSIAIYGGNVRMEDQISMRIGIPSINTLTFVYSEHTFVNDTSQKHFTVQKQNLRMMGGFQNRKVIGRVILSPDSFYVTRYIDKPSYTWVDLAGALGGMASLALAVWIFLFGSGRYKSWGVMQRYILQTSPNSRRYREKQPEPQGVFAKMKRFFQRQLTRLDSSAESELDHVPLQSPAFHDSHQRASLRYSTALNANQIKLAAVPAGARGKGARPEGNVDTSRYSMESSGNANFYFSDQGTPGTRSLQPLAPLNESGPDDEEMQVEELIRLIDLRIDERMWSLERTLSRYYLDGFRLRNYSAHPNAGTFYFNEGMSNSDPSAMERGSPMEFLPGDETPPSTTPPIPVSPSVPSYPPRPPMGQPRYTVVEGSRASNTPATAPAPAAAALSSAGTKEEISETSAMSPPQFPRRGDMRGTIRSAVQRLQHEWPQSQAYEAYVPRTQYQSRSEHYNSSNRSHGNAPATGDESPPRY
ncbi:hypothetical protein KVV02_005895 [Mortierella alpina]|uniref:Uncharacterized protein n=1 Tax=Mortierella alpina TaxID=64518 RepID=A0A9P7ZZE8_MORAP|nr:hypothetical protein KVV02_005895 [Mortierella alpina]